MRKALMLGAAALAAVSAANAHHSFAMFDNGKEQTIEGVVKEFQWANPHVWIQVNVAGSDGKVVEYSIEAASVNSLKRSGWTRKTIQAGDKIKLIMHPLRDGAPGGSFVSALINGEPLSRNAVPAPAPKPAPQG